MIKEIIKVVVAAVLAFVVGLTIGAALVRANECKPIILKAVDVHAWEEHKTKLLVFTFVDNNCDNVADIVMIVEYLGYYNGRLLFTFVSVIDPFVAEEAIRNWQIKTRLWGKSC